MKHLATWLLAMALLLAGGVPFSAAETIQLKQDGGGITPLGGVGDRAKVSTGGAEVQITTLASGITTNTTSTPIAGVSGFKTVWADISGTGAVSASVDVYGSMISTTTATKRQLLATIELTGTAETSGAVASMTGNYPYLHIEVRSISGTGATVNAYLNY